MEQLTNDKRKRLVKQIFCKIIKDTNISETMLCKSDLSKDDFRITFLYDNITIFISIQKEHFSIGFLFTKVQDKKCIEELNKTVPYGKFYIVDKKLFYEVSGKYLTKKIIDIEKYIFDTFISCYDKFFMANNEANQKLKEVLGNKFPFEEADTNKKEEKEISIKTTTIEKVAEFLANKDVLMGVILQRALYITYPKAIEILEYLEKNNVVIITINNRYKIVDKEKVKKAIIELSPTFM